MRYLFVILDGSSGVKQAAYTAFDVAARTSAKLIGAVIQDQQSQSAALQAREEFETGARAAGVGFEVENHRSLFEGLASDTNKPIDAIFISRSGITGQDFLIALVDRITCPLWIVPEQREIRRMMAIYDSSPAASAVLDLAVSLARRWEIKLDLLAFVEEIKFKNSLPRDYSVRISVKNGKTSNPETLNQDIVRRRIDLALIGKPNDPSVLWDLTLQLNCLLAICPALNSF